jgi:methionine-rich copper-binding protein CopC
MTNGGKKVKEGKASGSAHTPSQLVAAQSPQRRQYFPNWRMVSDDNHNFGGWRAARDAKSFLPN